MIVNHLLPFLNKKQLLTFRILNSLFYNHISSLPILQQNISTYHNRLYHIQRAILYLPHRIKKIIKQK